MRTGWAFSILDEKCHIEYGTRVIKKRDAGTEFPVYGGGGETFRIDRFNREKCTVVSRFGMSEACVRHVDGKFFLNDSGLSVSPKNPRDLLPLFLDYFLYASQRLIYSLGRGSAQKNLDVKAFRKVELFYPESLSEQKRIVAILGEAFASIDASIANTEKNLANTRELFESYLDSVFSQRGEGWVDTSIGCQITLQRGFDITKKEQKLGSIPVVSSGGIKSYHDTAKVEGPGVVIGRKGSLGTVHFVENDYWPHDTTLWVKDFKTNNVRLVYYFLRSMDLKSLDTGTANPALNRNLVHPIPITWPAPEVQESLVRSLDSVADEARRLDSIYQQKLTALAELKQSLLQKAFSGELTADKAASDATLKEEVCP